MNENGSVSKQSDYLSMSDASVEFRMQVSLHNYRPSNFSAVLRAETHTFVTVQGSRATAIIGLMFYVATMLLCLYLTWVEFTEIIHRRFVTPLGSSPGPSCRGVIISHRTCFQLTSRFCRWPKVVIFRFLERRSA